MSFSKLDLIFVYLFLDESNIEFALKDIIAQRFSIIGGLWVILLTGKLVH